MGSCYRGGTFKFCPTTYPLGKSTLQSRFGWEGTTVVNIGSPVSEIKCRLPGEGDSNPRCGAGNISLLS